MKKIYIFGLGKGKEILKEYLLPAQVEILGYIDNFIQDSTKRTDGKPVLTPEQIRDDFDYIIVSVMRYRHIYEQLLSYGISDEKIICFFSFADAVREEYWSVIEKNGWRVEAVSYEFQKKIRPFCQNVIYELGAQEDRDRFIYPHILPAEDAVEKIIRHGMSLVRFGDGEFELMRMRKRAGFQSVNRHLAERLKQILASSHENILVALADNYGSLKKYTTEAAEDIREYLTPEVRREHMSLIDPERIYYDAYLSRPYILYEDKTLAGARFAELKKIWEGKKILIVEGDKTRMGIGNDLFDNAEAVRRIVVPNVDAYEKYGEILHCVRQNVKDELILIALGPTATVLAYDLAVSGFWALDIGHVDLEYEWYCMGAKERCNIPHKYVNELGKGERTTELPARFRDKYELEIAARI